MRDVPPGNLRAFITDIPYQQDPLGTLRVNWSEHRQPPVLQAVVEAALLNPTQNWNEVRPKQNTPMPEKRLQRLPWHWQRYRAASKNARPDGFIRYLYAWHQYFQ